MTRPAALVLFDRKRINRIRAVEECIAFGAGRKLAAPAGKMKPMDLGEPITFPDLSKCLLSCIAHNKGLLPCHAARHHIPVGLHDKVIEGIRAGYVRAGQPFYLDHVRADGMEPFGANLVTDALIIRADCVSLGLIEHFDKDEGLSSSARLAGLPERSYVSDNIFRVGNFIVDRHSHIIYFGFDNFVRPFGCHRHAVGCQFNAVTGSRPEREDFANLRMK